jgi:hypothetical protein
MHPATLPIACWVERTARHRQHRWANRLDRTFIALLSRGSPLTLGTHAAFASVLYLGGATLFGYRPDLLSWALAAVASVLPDIDLPPSRIGQLFGFNRNTQDQE